jgi:hypothetical protein
VRNAAFFPEGGQSGMFLSLGAVDGLWHEVEGPCLSCSVSANAATLAMENIAAVAKVL